MPPKFLVGSGGAEGGSVRDCIRHLDIFEEGEGKELSFAQYMTVRQQLVVAEREIIDATDKIILPQSFLDAILREHFNKDLPYPITFAVAAQGRKTHVGVREFSADEGHIILSTVVAENLAVTPGMELSVSLVSLEKGESATFRPLAAGYDLGQDWKIALEGAFRSAYTTLTKGDIIKLKSGLRFLVDDLEPTDSVCIVDTDLEVNLEPLSEEQARETVEVNRTATQAKTIQIKLDDAYEGSQVVDMVLGQWDRARPLQFTLNSTCADAALLIGTEASSTLTSHIISNLNSSTSKGIVILPSNTALETASALHISVDASTQTQFSLLASQTINSKADTSPSAEETRCPNCSTVVPKRSFVLHERHCLRNNTKCQVSGCSFIFRKGIDVDHWHCDICNDPGEGSLTLHKERMHTQRTCECGQIFPNIPTLAHHRALDCSEKLIICQFCHLKVAQGDAAQVSYHDASMHLTAHESECGARTTECETCRRRVKLKDLPTHLRIHDSQRLTHTTPRICTNRNCVHERGGSRTLGLCSDCFGPLYSSVDDPDLSKLLARIKRRVATQLVSGCRRPYCRNTMCATATGHKETYATALARVSPLVLPHDGEGDGYADDDDDNDDGGETFGFSFCVNEVVQRKRDLASTLEHDGSYADAWCRRASAVATDEFGARAWLARSAVTKSEARRREVRGAPDKIDAAS